MAGRWAVSLLSRNRSNDAYKEEVMIDKSTGEIAVKTNDKGIDGYASYDFMSRRSSTINTIRSITDSYGKYGEIWWLDTGIGSQLPMFFKGQGTITTMNLLSGIGNIDKVIVDKGLHILLYIDMDIEGGGFSLAQGNSIKYTHDASVEIKYTTNGQSITKSLQLDDFNRNLIKNINLVDPQSNITITKLDVTTNNTIPNGQIKHIILHGIYVFIEKEV